MALDPRKVESVRRRQRDMFTKVLDRRTYNFSIKEIASQSGLDDTSVSNYAGGVTTMSLTAIDALVGIIPDELLSLLLPEGRAIVRIPEGINHEELATAAAEYLAAKNAAHHPESEAQRDIGPNEKRALDTCALKLVVNG